MRFDKKIFFRIIFISALLILLIMPGSVACSIDAMVNETYTGTSSLKVRDIRIDEMEVESIGILDVKMENSYDVSQQSISSIADELNNPFKPFYTEDEDSVEKNILILEGIHTEGDDSYCDLRFNDSMYLLTAKQVFNEIYMIQAINETSVSILKGDEVLTLFIGDMLRD